MRTFSRRLLLLAAGLMVIGHGLACNASASLGPDGARRLLFIGNSYLYTQNIPAVVAAFAKAGGEEVIVRSVTGPDMGLYDHLQSGAAVSTVQRNRWGFVILQQGPSSVSYNRDSLVAATRIFDALIRRSSGKTALFSSWPSQSRQQDFARAIESYQLAAADVNGIYLPVAPAWLIAWQMDPSLQLYSDGLHPSAAGAYLSAMVVYATIFQKTPRGLPNEVAGLVLDLPTATILQSAAAQATGY
jgi:hypothetical protein